MFARPTSQRAERARTISYVLAALVLIAVLGGLVLAWWAQERITYQPPAIVESTPAGAMRVDYTAADGQPAFALIVAPPAPATHPAVVLAFHGNADIAPWLVPWAVEIARRSHVVVVIPEYRGYNGVPGPPTAEGIRLDSRAALAYVRAHYPPNSRLVYYGHSLGTALATEFAEETLPSTLVLESPFTSARAIAANFGTPIVGWLWSFIGRIPYDTKRRVSTLNIPVWVAHGERDRVIPVRMGREVFAAARRPGELLIIPSAGHNDLVEAGREQYWQWLERAVR